MGTVYSILRVLQHILQCTHPMALSIENLTPEYHSFIVPLPLTIPHQVETTNSAVKVPKRQVLTLINARQQLALKDLASRCSR